MKDANYKKQLDIKANSLKKIENAERKMKEIERELLIVSSKLREARTIIDRTELRIKEAELIDEYSGYEDFIKIVRIELAITNLTLDAMDRKIDSKKFTHLINQLKLTNQIADKENTIAYMQRQNAVNQLKLQLLNLKATQGKLTTEEENNQRKDLMDDSYDNEQTIDENLSGITKLKIEKIKAYLYYENPNNLSYAQIEEYLEKLKSKSQFDEYDLALLDEISKEEKSFYEDSTKPTNDTNYQKQLNIKENALKKIEDAEKKMKEIAKKLSIVSSKLREARTIIDRTELKIKEAELIDEYSGYEDYIKIVRIELSITQLTIDAMDRKIEPNTFSYLLNQLKLTKQIENNENSITYAQRQNEINQLKIQLLNLKAAKGKVTTENENNQRKKLMDDIYDNEQIIIESLREITKLKIEKIKKYLYHKNPNNLSHTQIEEYLEKLKSKSQFDEYDLSLLDEVLENEHIELDVDKDEHVDMDKKNLTGKRIR